jgi:hypothetical protein
MFIVLLFTDTSAIDFQTATHVGEKPPVASTQFFKLCNNPYPHIAIQVSLMVN